MSIIQAQMLGGAIDMVIGCSIVIGFYLVKGRISFGQWDWWKVKRNGER